MEGEGVGVKGKWRSGEGGCSCISAFGAAVSPCLPLSPPSFFFRNNLSLRRKCHATLSAQPPSCPALRQRLSHSLQLSLPLAHLLCCLRIRSFLFLRCERGKLDSHVQIMEEEKKRGKCGRRLLFLIPPNQTSLINSQSPREKSMLLLINI